MADTNRSPGPFAGCRDGYCQQAAGVVANGHVITVSMARFARQKLTDRGASAGDLPTCGLPARRRQAGKQAGRRPACLRQVGRQVDATGAQPRVSRMPNGWRISLLRLDDLELDWARPPEVGLAFVLDISPRGKAPALRDAAWRLSGTVLTCEATVGRRRLSLRYDPPRIGRLTRQARFFDVRES